MAAELLDLVASTTLAMSAAIVAALLLRRPLRRLAGPRFAYASWLLVPLALLALALPARTVLVEQPLIDAVRLATPSHAGSAGAAQPVPSAGTAIGDETTRSTLLTLWLAGSALAAGLFGRQQWRFRRRIGRLRRRDDGSFAAATRLLGPALLGLLRPRIIVPLDFDQRYDAEQRALILAHETVHLRRGDLLANFAVTAARCLYWFNPLLHIAASRFRADQELACDAAVIARFPESRRRYADAMLKTQLADLGLPVGCTWQSSHPIRERITMLNKPLPGALRSALGAAAVVAVSISCVAAVWAAQPPTVQPLPAHVATAEARAALAAARGNPIAVGDYQFELVAAVGEHTHHATLHADAGRPFAVRLGEGAAQVVAEFRFHPSDDGAARFDLSFMQQDQLIAADTIEADAEGRVEITLIDLDATPVRVEIVGRAADPAALPDQTVTKTVIVGSGKLAPATAANFARRPILRAASDSEIAVAPTMEWSAEFLLIQTDWARQASERAQVRVLLSGEGLPLEFHFSKTDIPGHPQFGEVIRGIMGARIAPALDRFGAPVPAWVSLEFQAPPAALAARM
jgi:beta-lactamase regulating signal transducer with metallopeptidase domain